VVITRAWKLGRDAGQGMAPTEAVKAGVQCGFEGLRPKLSLSCVEVTALCVWLPLQLSRPQLIEKYQCGWQGPGSGQGDKLR
jgi:hypothetical protein